MIFLFIIINMSSQYSFVKKPEEVNDIICRYEKLTEELSKQYPHLKEGLGLLYGNLMVTAIEPETWEEEEED